MKKILFLLLPFLSIAIGWFGFGSVVYLNTNLKSLSPETIVSGTFQEDVKRTLDVAEQEINMDYQDARLINLKASGMKNEKENPEIRVQLSRIRIDTSGNELTFQKQILQ